MIKYYVEFEHTSDDESYCLQSRWFITKASAIMWFQNGFDFIRDDVIVRLMKSEFDENGNYGDIECEEILTGIYTWRETDNDGV